MNDKELDLLLAEYRDTSPTELQVQKWKRRVRDEVHRSQNPRRGIWLQLVAASVAGFVFGALVMGGALRGEGRGEISGAMRTSSSPSDEGDATIEYVFTKSP